MANDAYRAVFLRVHPTGKMVLSLKTEPDGNEDHYAQIVAEELGVPALDDVIAAIGGVDDSFALPVPEPELDEEPWASATPVPGSSVAMPSGYGPSRGRTTPGWSLTDR